VLLAELVIVAPPKILVHCPIPFTGRVAFKFVVVVVTQSLWSGPALAGEPRGLTVTLTSVNSLPQALETVQRNIFNPLAKPVTVVLGLVLFPKTPLPETTVHKPVPLIGADAVMVVLFVPQRLIGAIALGGTTGFCTLIVTSSKVVTLVHWSKTVHLKVFAPRVKPLTVVLN
jgi:hypothetical protein